MCPPENWGELSAFDPEQSVLSSPLCGRNFTKYGHVFFRGTRRALFFAVKTVWRRGRDSITTLTCKLLLNLHFRDNTLGLWALQGDSISGWSFYGFSHSLDFRAKRYHWYQ
jgi:hypothetical protein